MGLGLLLRQTQGLVRCFLQFLELAPLLDDSTFCRRAQKLLIVSGIRAAGGAIALVVARTGLRVHGGRDWVREQHGCQGSQGMA